jgi:hypothetical protein
MKFSGQPDPGGTVALAQGLCFPIDMITNAFDLSVGEIVGEMGSNAALQNAPGFVDHMSFVQVRRNRERATILHDFQQPFMPESVQDLADALAADAEQAGQLMFAQPHAASKSPGEEDPG